MKNKILIHSVITFLLTGFFNNTHAINILISSDTIPNSNNTIIKYDIERECKDSIIQDIENEKIHLYGEASIKYGDIKINANYIVIDWRQNTIFATGSIDSTGKIIGNPVFSEGNESFKSKEILYNIQSKRCIVKKIITQEGEGYIHGLKVKKQTNDVMYIRKGEYTTCNAEHPHYSIRSKKIKLLPNKHVVTGPAYLTFFNIPTPLFLPFGYFPNTDKESSGILIPSYGESVNLGFFLKDGGYYFSLNNYLDLTIKADIYTKGSWLTRNNLRYKKRYKYNGNINLSYGNIINGEKGFPNHSIKRDFFIRWNHKQDPKANPSLRISANVNAGSSTYHKNNTFTNSNDYLSNTFTSSISFGKKWEGTPFNISSSLGHNQNTLTNKINLIIPDISFSMNRIFPFKNLVKPGKKRWYENIGIRYNLNMKNQISTYDSLLFDKSALNAFRNGMKHNIPINASFKLLKHFTFTQNISFSERWYLNRIEKTWNGTELIKDTINSFTRGMDYSFSSSINTKIYGITQFKKGKIAAFRHVLTPNISFNYSPSFADEKYGFYKTVQTNSSGDTEQYSIMENGIYGSPRSNKSGNISFGLGNIFGLKIRNNKDTVDKIRKIQLIESLNIRSSYNIFAEEFKFSNINIALRTRLFNVINLTHNSVFDPYVITEDGRINSLEIVTNKRLATFKNSNTSIGFSLNDKTFTKQEDDSEEDNMDSQAREADPRDFYKIPWNLNVNYIHSLSKGPTTLSEKVSTQTIGFSGNIKIASKWKIGFNSGYDFTKNNDKEWWKKFSYTSIDIYRDLHCWEMLFHWIPMGYQRSYTLTIRVKANILKDLKYEKRKDWIAPNFN